MAHRPEGFHSITPQIVVSDGAAAIDHYKQALGATEYGRMTMPGTGKIMHSCIGVGDSRIFLYDENPQMGQLAPKDGKGGASFYVYVDNIDATHKKAVAAGMTAKAEPSDMFWGDRMSSLTDRFGHNWVLATHTRDVTPAEMEQAMKAMRG